MHHDVSVLLSTESIFMNYNDFFSPSELVDYHPDFYKAIVDLGGANDYVKGHLKRYLHTLKHMPTREQFVSNEARVLELGTSDIFPFILRKLLRFDVVDVSCFDQSLKKDFERDMYESDKFGKNKGFNIDLESEPIPRSDQYYDMVLCFEVVEHLERDPMFMMAEINRVLGAGGLLYLSTPNVCSSRNVQKILEGYAPHFHMKYNKDRSLYRHNIEYSPGQLHSLATAAGFKARKVWTSDTFEAPSAKAMKLMATNGYGTEMRGDNFFGIYEKVSGVQNRWPAEIYA